MLRIYAQTFYITWIKYEQSLAEPKQSICFVTLVVSPISPRLIFLVHQDRTFEHTSLDLKTRVQIQIQTVLQLSKYQTRS